MKNKIEEKNDGVAIYHCVLKYENFDRAAQDIFDLIKQAQEKAPNVNRYLYLDIEGHRNSDGSFDEDMFELQSYFIMEQIYPYVSEIHEPLAEMKNDNPKNDIPKQLLIKKEEK